MLSKLEERNNEIIQELKDQGYANRKINYEEFLRIYEPYKEEMSEKDFAFIIGISESSFEDIKYQKRNAIILKDKKIEDKLIREIIEELIGKGYANKKINYEEFLNLYAPYKKKISEKNFARALGLSLSNYDNLKYQKFKVIILKNKQMEDKMQDTIREELIKQGYANKKINYEEFLKIYELYKEQISERGFARVLGLSESNYSNLKYQNQKVIIIKDKEIKDKLISEIRDELIRKGYTNKKIDYEEFLRIYEPYRKQISERNFARVLGLSNSNYNNLKYRKNKTVILKYNILEEKLIRKIKEELIKQGYANKKINYEEFLKLYEPYKEKISERNFARALDLLEDSFRKVKKAKF